MTENRWTHLECAVQIIVGSLLAQAVLFAFGVRFDMAVELNITMLSVGYARQYAIRRFFARLRDKHDFNSPLLSKDELRKIAAAHIPHGSL